jgi:apolipoprotein N-acyltransferase
MNWEPLRGRWLVADRAVLAVGMPLVVLGGYWFARGDEPPGWWLSVVVGLVLLSAAIRGLAEWRRRVGDGSRS